MSLLKMIMGGGGGYVPPPDPGNVPLTTAIVAIVMGQSNAAGGANATLIPAEYQGSQANKWIANKGNSGSPQPLVFQPMNAGVNTATIYNNFPVGIEQVLMETVQLYYQRRVFLIKIAYGGYAIDNFLPGGDYGNIMPQVFQDAEAWLLNNGYTDVMYLPVIWVQGETEAGNNVSTATYKAKEAQLISNVRGFTTRLANVKWISQLLSDQQTTYTQPQRDNINAAKIQNAAQLTGVSVNDPDTIIPLPEMQPGEETLHYSQNGCNQLAGDMIDDGYIPGSQILTTEEGFPLTHDITGEILEYE